MTRIALLALVATLALAAPASAKIWFQDMGGRHVRWDQRVTATISGCADVPECGDLVAARTVFVRAVHRGRLHRLARIDRKGRLRFRVPHLRPGRYRLVAREGGQPHAVSMAFRLRR